MRIAVPDLVTNSYFPALAAEELGYYAAEGLEAHVELLSPAPRAMAALRDGRVAAAAAGAHTALTAFPQWHGAKLVALAQGTPWLLVLRANIPALRGDLSAVKGLHLGAAPGPDAALRRLLADAGIDPARDGVHINPVPGMDAPGPLRCRSPPRRWSLDARWVLGQCPRHGNGGAPWSGQGSRGCAARWPARGGRLHVQCAGYDRRADRPGSAQVGSAVRAIVSVQRALQGDPHQAAQVGSRRFPPEAAAMITTVVKQDLPSMIRSSTNPPSPP